MDHRREIGRTIKVEQDLTEGDIVWLVAIAKAILRAFVWDEGEPMQTLANELGVSRTTLYAKLRLAIKALMQVRHCKALGDALVDQVQRLQQRLAQVEQAYTTARAQVQRLSKALTEAQAIVTTLKVQIEQLRAQWVVTQERLIVVLKMSGRCTVRSIVEVMAYGLGVCVSVGYVQGVITEAGTKANTALEKLLKVVPLSGAISVDEVFLKELGSKIWGVVIVDPLSGLVLRLQRCSERSKDAIAEVLQSFAEAGFKEKIKLCLTDMYSGYLKPVAVCFPNAVHQFCWFHIHCFHIGATVRQAKRSYEKAVKALASFDKEHAAPLSEAAQEQRQVLIETCDQAQRHWKGAQRFQRMLTHALGSPTFDVASTRLAQLIRAAAKVENPYVQQMGAFLVEHRTGLLVFYTCLESGQHLLKRLSRSQHKWVSLTKRWAVPITSNAAEHIFRCLRRYTRQMDHFGTAAATQRFFDLFAFYHNMHTLRAGKYAGTSLLVAAHTDVKQLFGTDDLYTILGFPPASQAFIRVKSVQSVAA
jgi:transposase